MVSKARDNRRAISGVIAPLSFMILDNVFLETSILASPHKRKIILDSIEKVEDRLILGTDYPLTVNQLVEVINKKFRMEKDYAPTIMSEEAFLLQDELTNKKLQKIYSNIHKIYK